MKKLLLIVGFLTLSACNLLVNNPSDCEKSEASQSTWNGLSFELPACWSAVTSGEDLVLVNEDKTNTVLLTLTPPDTVGLTATLTSRQNASNEKIFALVSDGSDPKAQDILISLTAEKSEENNLEGACDAPDYTYAYSLQKESIGLTYDLVFCWTATEIPTTEGPAALYLEKGDKTAWIQIVLMSGIPSQEKPEPFTKVNDEGNTVYSYDGYFTVTTNAPEDYDVQSTINSLNRAHE